MKYIDYVNDWFSLYINPVDYEGRAEQFIQHIFQTLPFLDKLPKNAEYNSLIDVITLNGQILIQIIEEDNPTDAAAAFVNLKEQIIRLKNHVKKYALDHFNNLFQQDPFFTKLKDYINSTAKSLSTSEWRAIQEMVIELKIEELSLELTIQLAKKDQVDDLITQTELDTLSIEGEKVRFLGKVRSLIVESKDGTIELKKSIEANLLKFCEYVEEQTVFKQKYDKRGMRKASNQFVKQQFNTLTTLEKISNSIKANSCCLKILQQQEKLKHRSHQNLQIIQQQIISTKQKLTTDHALYEKHQLAFEQALLAFYQDILRSPIDEKLQEVITLFQLEPYLSTAPQQGFLQRAGGLFKLVSKTIEAFLPSETNLHLSVLGATAGAFLIGATPLGIGAGLGVGIAAVKTNQKISYLANETKMEWQACLEGLYGKFTATYKSEAFQVNRALKSVCDNDATKAAVINAFYVRQLFEYDLKIASEQHETEIEQLKKDKAQLEKHYQQLKNGQVKSKYFWENCFRQDISVRVCELQRLIKTHTNAYLMCLYDESNGVQQHSQRDFHRDRLAGIMEDLNEISLLAKRNKWQQLREQNIAAYRTLMKTPLNYSFEEHVNRFVFHHSPGHLIFWLSEQAESPKSILGQPLPAFENKTFWHLLAEREDGAELMQQMLKAPEVFYPARTSAFLMQKIWSFIASFKNNALFDPGCTYQGMNPLAYAYQRGNIPLLRTYLQEILRHPKQVKAIGLHSVFHFMIEQYPQMVSLIDAVKPQGITTTLKEALPFYQTPSFELGMMTGLTMFAIKEGTLPQGKEQWRHFFLELQQDHSAYIQVNGLKDVKIKQMDDLALTFSQPAVVQLEGPAPLLLVNYQAGSRKPVAGRTEISARKSKQKKLTLTKSR